MQTSPSQTVKKTYFGITTLITGILCVLSLLSNYGVSQLDISQGTFNQLNKLTALFYCGSTQAAIVLGILGLTRKNDSKPLSWTGIVLAVIPFLVVFGQFLASFLR